MKWARIEVWDAVSGERRLRIADAHEGPITCVLSPGDGNSIISTSDDKPHAIRVWDAAKGEERARIDSHWIGSVVVSPDGQKVAARGLFPQKVLMRSIGPVDPIERVLLSRACGFGIRRS